MGSQRFSRANLVPLRHGERARRARMRASRNVFRRFVKSLPYMGASTDLIREDREHGNRASYHTLVDVAQAFLPVRFLNFSHLRRCTAVLRPRNGSRTAKK
jgi:hypothetical protein